VHVYMLICACVRYVYVYVYTCIYERMWTCTRRAFSGTSLQIYGVDSLQRYALQIQSTDICYASMCRCLI